MRDRDQDLATYQGLVWIIDPLDGTLNFVKQKDHFASMLAVYDHQPFSLNFTRFPVVALASLTA